MPRRAHTNSSSSTKRKKLRSATNPGLGRAIRNKYGGKPERENQAQGRVKRKDEMDPFSGAHATDFNRKKQAQKRLISVTEVSNLQEFMDTVNAQKELDTLRAANESQRE